MTASNFDTHIDTFRKLMGNGLSYTMPKEGPGWDGFDTTDGSEWVHRLGNLTLVATARNNQLGNASWMDKRTEYQRSEFELTRQVAQDLKEWTPDTVAARQRTLAREAVAHWRLGQLS